MRAPHQTELSLPRPPAGVTRRSFLGLVVAGATAAAVACSSDDGGARPPATTTASTGDTAPQGPLPDLFTLGVASGDPLPDAVILWTRLAPIGDVDPLPALDVTWEVARDESFRDVVASGVTAAEPALGHSVHVDATGLTPDTWYWYRFTSSGQTSPAGRTRTMPAAGDVPDRFTFAFASCQSWPSGFYSAYPHLVDEDLDAVLFLGDYIYEGGPGGEGAPRHHDSDEIITLADYRARYAQYRSDEGLQAAHARCPWIVTWDDHEVDNNYAGTTPEEGAPPVDFEARRAAAYQAYWEHMPLRIDPPEEASLRLHRAVSVGGPAEIFVLDTRQFRDDQVCDDGSGLPVSPRCDDATDPDRTILGAEQRGWLTEGLTSSTARWNVLANQVVLSDMPLAGMHNMDQWDGYTADRDAVLGAMAASQAPTVVVTGDIHLSGVGQLLADPADPASAPVGAELVGAGISSAFPEEFAPAVEAVADAIPTIEYVNAHQRGYVVVTLTPDEATADYRLVATVDEPTSAIATDASFTITPDRLVRRS